MSTARTPPKVGSESPSSPWQLITDVAFPATAAPTGPMTLASHQHARTNSVNLLSPRGKPNATHCLELGDERWENSFRCNWFPRCPSQYYLLSPDWLQIQMSSSSNQKTKCVPNIIWQVLVYRCSGETVSYHSSHASGTESGTNVSLGTHAKTWIIWELFPNVGTPEKENVSLFFGRF